MRTYIDVQYHPAHRGAEDTTGRAIMCLRCRVENRPRAKRALVTAVDVTGKGRLPVAYCGEHTPPELDHFGVGAGKLVCHICDRPTAEHSLLDACFR